MPTTSNKLSSTTGALVRTYVYTAAGQTGIYGSDAFSYNDRDRLMGVTVGSAVTSYLYNALGQLIEKSGAPGTSLYMYDEAGHLLGEYTSTGALTQETIWIGDTPVATLRPNGSGISIYYVHTDQLNTPKKVTRASDNALAWRWDQDLFGTAVPNQNPASLGTFIYNLRFPGQMYMSETGLNYNYFRDYDPQVGRYVESDPIGLRSGTNTYAYVRSNPIRYLDPRGLCPDTGSSVPKVLPFFAAVTPATTSTAEGIALLDSPMEILAVYGTPLTGAVSSGIGLGLTIDYFCTSCSNFAEGVGGSLYEWVHPYNSNTK